MVVVSYDIVTDVIKVHRYINTAKWKIVFYFKGTNEEGTSISESTEIVTDKVRLKYVTQLAIEQVAQVMPTDEFGTITIHSGGFTVYKL